jgi:hypothetical protein
VVDQLLFIAKFFPFRDGDEKQAVNPVVDINPANFLESHSLIDDDGYGNHIAEKNESINPHFFVTLRMGSQYWTYGH